MTLDQLNEQHKKEIDLFWVCHAERAENLENDQKEIAAHFVIGNHKSNNLLKKLLVEQRKLFEEKEKDELDMLLHMQKLERENMSERESKQKKLEWLLSVSQKDNGREL